MSPLPNSNSNLLIKVAIPSPLRREFDYLLSPSQAQNVIHPGSRVRVPFGSREVIGLALTTKDDSNIATDKLKSVLEVLDQEAIFDPATLELYLWASQYYQFPLGLSLQASLPKYVREGRPLELAPTLHWRLTLDAQVIAPNTLHRAPQQQKLFELLKTYLHFSTEEASVLLASPATSFLNSLAKKGLIETYNYSEAQQTPATTNSEQAPLYTQGQPLELNPEQDLAVKSVAKSLNHFHCFLLEGITGSGKTEVYLQLAAQVLQAGQQVLLLIPEIGLSPQTLIRFQKRFMCNIVTLHSGLNDTDRFSAWLQARNGQAKIIIGTRSAIFTPLENLGLIIVDEEHDTSYKQQEGFRYSARDLAIYRAKKLNIPIILGSATPSLESLHNALSSHYSLLHLTQRAGAALPPQFKFLDLRGQELQEGFSLPLLEAIKNHLKQNSQVLIFINRRGFAPLLQCHDCGWTATCPRCETGYTLHQNPPGLRCHHCESQSRLMRSCPECKSTELTAIGLGTERSEKVLNQHFDETPVLRIDRDTTRGKGAMSKIIDTVNSGLPCILIGTQMLAKGHHFPNVTLVAILDADSGLFSADFRGQEQMGQLLTQVAGRAGRGKNPGEVLIQTHHSSHPALNTLIQEGYATFARQLLLERQQTNLPPYSYFILFRAEASTRSLPEQFLSQVRRIASGINMSCVSILGPMPAPMEKRAGRFRTQLLLQSNKRSNLHQLSRLLIEAVEGLPESRKVRWSVDVDPVDFT